MEDWIPVISESRLAENNRRFCKFEDGSPLEETVLKASHLYTYMYSIDKQEKFPASNILGTIRLEEKSSGETTLYWDLELDVESNDVFDQIKPGIESIYASEAENLERNSLIPQVI